MTEPAASPFEVVTPASTGRGAVVMPGAVVNWLDQSNLSAGSGGTPVPACQGAPLPVQVVSGGAGGSTTSTVAQGAAGTSAWPVADTNSAAFMGVVQLTPGSSTPATPARGLGFVCTAAGTLTITFANGSTMALPIAASPILQTLSFAVTTVALSNGAAGTFWNLV